MATYTNLSSLFTNIANAIRNKRNINTSIPANSFPEAIAAIPDDRLSTYAQNGLSEFIDDNITEIRDYAFLGDYNLKKISCANVSRIGIGGLAFDIYFPAIALNNYSYSQTGTLVSISLPSCTILDVGAFMGQGELSSFYLPNVLSIGQNAFTNCTSLNEVNFSLATYLGRSAFSGCSNLTMATFPIASIIPGRCFVECKSLTSVIFNEASIIGDNAFSKCENLEYLYAPMVTQIQMGAFSDCNKIATLSFNNLSNISTWAFAYCSSLMSLYITGSSVATLKGIDALQNTPMEYSVSGNYGSIYVPASLVTEYQDATNWTYFSSRITAI